jgi:UDP-N-acetylmuramoyl-tripeptide--D-alanyl-D-alanine ligase
MKKLFKKVVLWLLKRMAKFRLRKFKGKIITVTGSLGKTSTKEAVFCVLNSQYKVKKNLKSMNTDFGLLLTILDIDSGFSSVTKWSWFLLKGFFNSFFRDCSEFLLLEFGVDKPADMDFLLSVVKPDIAVFTNVSPVHLADGQFRDLQDIFDEKRKMVDALRDGGVAVLNVDNPFLARLAKERGKKNTMTFGENNEDAQYLISKIAQSVEGISFILNHKDKKYKVEAGVLGAHQTYVLTPALICAEIVGMDVEVAISALKRFSLPPGRMTIIPAKEEAMILDSSYNSSPDALLASLKVLKEVAGDHRKVAVLGSMNELGDKSRSLHEIIGESVPKYVDLLLTVGEEAKLIAKKAEECGMNKKNISVFKTADEAAEFFKDKIKKGDIVLVKGSQNRIHLERFVKELMANPDDADKLLVRQEKVWKSKF